ncbi:MAG: hypothetical protein IJP89_07630 [Synergistaceae bacterium]|nr:hypothetical protein [Synergistaceae bacterium]
MGDVMRRSNPDSFFVAFTYLEGECLRGNSSYDGRVQSTYDFGSGVDADGTISDHPGKAINIFEPEPVYYGRKITVLQVQRVNGDADGGNSGMFIAEVIYMDDSKPGNYNLPAL